MKISHKKIHTSRKELTKEVYPNEEITVDTVPNYEFVSTYLCKIEQRK